MFSNGSSSDVGASGVQHGVPRDSQELHDRAHTFLASVAPTLNSIEAVLNEWNQRRSAPRGSDGLPKKSDFRAVRIDSFTVQQPPPTVSEAEITQYIQKLSRKDLKALHNEYELTAVDDFDYVREGDDIAETTPGAAARIVHFVTEAAEGKADTIDAADDAIEEATSPLAPPAPGPGGVSVTTRARELFESEGASVERLHVGAGNKMTEVLAAAPPSTTSQTPPAFSLEAMSPSAVAAYEHRRTASTDSSGSSLCARLPTASGAPIKESYTVEIEYTADHFIPSAAQRALRDGAGKGIMIKSAGHPASNKAKPTHATLDSDGEVDGAEADIQSFSTFSRMVLANEGRRLTSQRAAFEAPVAFISTQPAVVSDVPDASATAAPASVAAATPPPPPSPPAPAATAAVAPKVETAPQPERPAPSPAAAHNMVSVKVVRKADRTSARDAFVRQRVRDILLANRVRAADATALGAAFSDKLESSFNVCADETTPLLHHLDDLVCEASALLHTLEVMDHEAYRQRVMDPAQYLCVPRHSIACAAPDCHTAFSATVTRVMCGRCGQFFCPKCCAERGLGPDVMCDGDRYSLGWEPLCRVCFQMCRDSQQKVVEERSQYLRIADVPARHRADNVDDGDSDAAADRAAADNLTLKQAVLFGAYCDENHCLGDGLPPFYVIDRAANEGVAFWDILSYKFAKSQGSLRRGWQSAGSFAAQAMQTAAQVVSKRRATLR